MSKHKLGLISIILIFFVPIFLFAQTGKNLDELNWLANNWISVGEKFTTYENWQKISPITFEGTGLTIKKATNDTTNFESLLLVKMAGEIFYIAKVAHNQFPIGFKLTEYSDSTAVFENPSHDFPTSIEYRKLGTDRIMVKVANDKQHFMLEFKKSEN